MPPFGDEAAGWSLDRFDVARRSLERVPLEEAAWEPVEGLKIDGLDVSAEE